MTRISGNMSGCPKCGGKSKFLSEFYVCVKCGHRMGTESLQKTSQVIRNPLQPIDEYELETDIKDRNK